MCGRFALSAKTDQIEKLIPDLFFEEELDDRYNYSPGQDIPVVLDEDPGRGLKVRWGLIPFWAKDPKIGYKMINARSETIDSKPSFRNSFKKKRCLVIADGYYEWRKEPNSKVKVPYFIRMKDGLPFTFAGLWEKWKSPDGKTLTTTTIITTEPNDELVKIHDRMPAILLPEERMLWLERYVNPMDLKKLLLPCPEEIMESWEVSLRVNSPKNDDKLCIEPVSELF
jgi:putative SOS response-associated peptidase YedK